MLGGCCISKPTIADVIATAFTAEEKAKTFYEVLMEKCIDVPGSYELWKDMAHDEADHAMYLMYLGETLSEDVLRSEASNDMVGLVEAVHKMDLSNYSLRNTADGLKLAHEIETAEINFLFAFIVEEFVKDSLKKKIILGEIQNHQQKLVKFQKDHEL